MFKARKMGFGKRRMQREFCNKPLNGTFHGVTYHFRSKAEYNWALWCDKRVELDMIGSWKYEPARIHFKDNKRGPYNYLPDFWIYDNEGAVIRIEEVKGYLDSKSRSQFKKWSKEGRCPIWLVMTNFTASNANGRRLADKYCERIVNMRTILTPLKGVLEFV